MDKELPPPYPGPPLKCGAALPGTYSHSGVYPSAPPLPEFYSGNHHEVYPNPQFSPEAPLTVGHPGGAPYFPVQAAPVQTGSGQTGSVTVVTHVMLSNSLGELPGYTECPHCHKIVLTTTQYTPGLMTFLACVGIALVAWVCCFLPCCIKSCQDVKHHCPDCKKLIYKYTRM